MKLLAVVATVLAAENGPRLLNAPEGYEFKDVCISPARAYMLSGRLLTGATLEVVEQGGARRRIFTSNLENAESLVACDDFGVFVVLGFSKTARILEYVRLDGEVTWRVDVEYKFFDWVAVAGGFLALSRDEIVRVERDGGVSARLATVGASSFSAGGSQVVWRTGRRGLLAASRLLKNSLPGLDEEA